MVTATNSFNLSAEDSVTVEVVAGPGVPLVAILSPDDNDAFFPGETITFQGSATDPEDGDLTAGLSRDHGRNRRQLKDRGQSGFALLDRQRGKRVRVPAAEPCAV